MARIWLASVIAALAPSGAWAQQANAALQAAGVCARCHVNAVLEWEMSRHASAGNSCSVCHGASRAHVADERNNVRPDRLPRGAQIAALCLSCHDAGCPKAQTSEACQSCHHVHALLDPSRPASARPERENSTFTVFQSAMKAGERALALQDWRAAAVAFRRAAEVRPDARVIQRFTLALRKLSPDLPGMRPLTSQTHPELGLPLEVEVSGHGVRMMLAPGGDVDLGDDSNPALRPAHTVSIAPFYVSVRLESRSSSWTEATRRVAALNRLVEGGGFRLPSEPELALAWRVLSWRSVAAEWCSSLFWPYPYDARDGREDPAATGPRVVLKQGRRQGSPPAGQAAFRLVRSIPIPKLPARKGNP